ncbi:MAG TPA: hypothetical protein VFW63_03480, partial [Acidimicrobiales bacterium]|nr:hypothetical protein [Acidimicrobiales bacterium]
MALDGTDPADEARVTGARIGPGGLLARPRLVEHLRRAVRGRLTVVSAPAGSGKTVALEQWVAGHRDGPVTWVAPAGSDAGRRPVRGLDGPTAGGGRHRAPPSADTGDAVVVVDPLPDSAPATAAGLEPLLAGVPDGAHVVVATRRRWPAPAGGDPEVVARLDEGYLALTAPEAGTVLAAASGRQDLTPRHVEVLLARTAGWPAGLRLAAAALRHAPDLDRFVDGFTGEEPHVAGFLRHEVLAGQSAGVRRFLTCTSVLDRLGGPLCDALTGDGGGATTLRSLEARGLFTRAVAPGGWYAYHPLFRDVLRQELRRRAPHAEAELLARAAAWHVDHDDPEPAARYLAEAEAWDELVRLVDHHGSPAGRSGGAERGLRWLDALPGGTSPRRPDGATRRAYLLTTQGRARLAQRLLHEAGSDPADPGERVLRQAVRALWGFLDAPPAPVVEAADAVLAEVDRVEPADIPDILGATSPATLRSLAAGSRGRALWSLGDLPASRAAFALAAAGPDVPLPWEPAVLGARALLEAWSGHLRVARALAGRALAVAGPPLAHHPVTVDAGLAAAHVARERGELPLADGYLGEVAALVAGSERPTALAVHAVERGLWHLAAGRPD